MNKLQVKKIRENLGLNQEDFGKLLGVSKNTILNYEKGGKIPESKIPILEKFMNENPNIVNEDNETYSPTPQLNNNKGVPYYDVDFVGGFDMIVNDQTLVPKLYIDFQPFNDADFWINITGKSMSPFISHGDIVALKHVSRWKEFLLLGEIYAIITDDFRTIKILGKGKDDNHLNLIPYNKSAEFTQQEIPISLIGDIFRVIGSIKKFF